MQERRRSSTGAIIVAVMAAISAAAPMDTTCSDDTALSSLRADSDNAATFCKAFAPDLVPSKPDPVTAYVTKPNVHYVTKVINPTITFQVAGNAVTTTTITTPCAAGATGADGAPAVAPNNAHQVVAPAPTVKAAPAAPVIAPAQGRVAGTIPIGGTGGARVIHAKRDVTKPDYLATCNDEQVTNACKSLLTNNAAGKNVLVAETVTMTTSVGPTSTATYTAVGTGAIISMVNAGELVTVTATASQCA